MEVIYRPGNLSISDPGTIQYNLVLGVTPYTSGPLSFERPLTI